MAAKRNTGKPVEVNAYVPPWPGEMLTLAGRQVYVRHAPPTTENAVPAVYIHGLGGSSTNWTELMDLLKDSVDGVAVDLPGFGRTPPPPDGDYTPLAHARAVRELIEERWPGQQAHIFGNSLGGATAVQLAARYPEVVRSVTLVSPALPERLPRLSNIHMPVVAIPGVGERLVKRVMTKPAEWRMNSSLDICYANMGRIHPQRRAEMLEEVAYRERLDYATSAMLGSLRGLMATYFDYSSEQPWKIAAKISVPVLLVYGRDDKLVNPKAAFRANKVFPLARVVVIPDSGHVSQMEHPELVAGAWRELAR